MATTQTKKAMVAEETQEPERLVYLDNNATTMCDPRVVDAMVPFFAETYGNPNSLHRFGAASRGALQRAYDKLYAALGANDEDDVIVTGCACEADNTIIKSFVLGEEEESGDPEPKRIITSAVEHPAIINTCEWAAKRRGVKLSILPVDEDGIISVKTLKAELEKCPEKKVLVSIMWANNETGLINPIHDLVRCAKQLRPTPGELIFHSDAVQAIGKVEVHARKSGVDALTIAAHKFHGPKGVGALYLKAGMPLTPLIHGGEQMSGKRAGTVNVAGAVGMALALELAVKAVADGTEAKVGVLRDRLEDGILKGITGASVIGDRKRRVPNTILVSFKGVEGEAMLWDLNRAGVAASTGSACASESLQANPTFVAMSVDPELSHTGIRLSLSRFTTEQDVDYALAALKAAISRLRNITGSL